MEGWDGIVSQSWLRNERERKIDSLTEGGDSDVSRMANECGGNQLVERPQERGYRYGFFFGVYWDNDLILKL